MRRLLVLAMAVATAHFGAPAAAAQSSVTPLELPASGTTPGGWSFTPAIDYALVWDSNVLMENVGSTIVSEQVHVLKPRGTLGMIARRGSFSASYSGAFVQHPTLSSLNSYDQRVAVNGTRLLTRRTSIFAHYSALSSPTTELVELVGVPFSRVGSERQDVRAGIGTQLSRRTELRSSYRYQKIDFDQSLDELTLLNGGYSHGGTLGLKHGLTQRWALTADYYLDRATFVSGSTFMVQNGWAGLEYAIDADTRVFGSGGTSYLSAVDGRPARTGPALQVGVSRDVHPATLTAGYTRSFVPSYGFGGTSNNEELRVAVRMPFAQRWFTQSAVSFRRNEPLEQRDLALRSLWFHGSLGYLLTNWARVEGYTSGSRQSIARPDGRVNRYTFGVQVTAATTTRIR